MQYIGFWRRFAAVIVDGLIISVAQSLVNTFFGGGQGGFNMALGIGPMISGTSTISVILNLIISIGYVTWFQAKFGQTLGKKALGIKVVDAKGKTPSAFTFFLRDVIGKTVSALILGIGFLMVIWDSKKQGLHDKIASTYVVKA